MVDIFSIKLSNVISINGFSIGGWNWDNPWKFSNWDQKRIWSFQSCFDNEGFGNLPILLQILLKNWSSLNLFLGISVSKWQDQQISNPSMQGFSKIVGKLQSCRESSQNSNYEVVWEKPSLPQELKCWSKLVLTKWVSNCASLVGMNNKANLINQL